MGDKYKKGSEKSESTYRITLTIDNSSIENILNAIRCINNLSGIRFLMWEYFPEKR